MMVVAFRNAMQWVLLVVVNVMEGILAFPML